MRLWSLKLCWAITSKIGAAKRLCQTSLGVENGGCDKPSMIDGTGGSGAQGVGIGKGCPLPSLYAPQLTSPFEQEISKISKGTGGTSERILDTVSNI